VCENENKIKLNRLGEPKIKCRLHKSLNRNE
jgi:hypothetical protein